MSDLNWVSEWTIPTSLRIVSSHRLDETHLYHKTNKLRFRIRKSLILLGDKNFLVIIFIAIPAHCGIY